MKHFIVSITDGNDIKHNWNVTGNSKYAVLRALLETFNDDSYGMPYGIHKDGIKAIDVHEQKILFGGIVKMANYKFYKLSESYSKVLDKGNVSLHISTSNSKLGCIPSFNLLPGLTCSPESCKHCLREGCYAVKNVFRCGYNVDKNSTLSAWTENTVLAFTDIDRLESELIDYLNSVQAVCKLFRIHSSGDFFSVEYATMWYRLAKRFPNIRFLAFSKQWDIVRKVKFYTLPNFSLVLSGWTCIPIPDDLRKHYRCAWCDDGIETRIPANAMLCPGNCETCGMCWYLNELGRDTKFIKH